MFKKTSKEKQQYLARLEKLRRLEHSLEDLRKNKQYRSIFDQAERRKIEKQIKLKKDEIKAFKRKFNL